MKYISLILILVLTSSGCKWPNQPNNPLSVNSESQVEKVVDYGNGVYYFDEIRSEFGIRLSVFLKKNNCHIEGITGDGTAGYGTDAGYWVVCR